MSSDRPVPDPTDLAGMRATAHPTRVEIMNLLRQHAALTATEFANMLNLSPKTCSYHLNTLAAHGLVVEVPSAGRNRPWRLAPSAPGAGAPGGESPAPEATLGNPIHQARDRILAVRLRRDESILLQASEAINAAAATETWSTAVTVHTRLASMTAEELRAWTEDVERLTTRHVRRSAQAGELDGDGERREVHLMFYGFPISV